MAGTDDHLHNTGAAQQANTSGRVGPRTLLAGLAVVSWLAYLMIALSGRSLHEASSGDNSLLVQLGLFALAFACYLMAISVAVHVPHNRWLLAFIIVPAVIFRLTLLFSDPI